MSLINLNTSVAGITFENCLMNAAGVLGMTEEEIIKMKNSEAATWITKSCTLEPRTGNESPRYKNLKLGSINSMGLPNLGYEFYINNSINHQKNNSAINFISVAGLTLEDNLFILRKIQESKFKGLVELNLSCPNIEGKPQTAYDFERTKIVLDKTFEIYNKPLGLKLPPYFDIIHFEQMADIINQFPVKFVTCINSIGNALYIDAETESVVIKPKNGFGGLGGEYIKPTALANVKMFRNLLNNDIDIIGCGGITNGKDVFEHILCGASMVQIATQLMKEGTSIFNRIKNELIEIMKNKNYSSINDFKNKLKYSF